MEDNNRRAEILKAAKVCFKDKGFYGASINEIAKTAGITKSLLYYYFKSKEDIFIALMQESLERLMKTVKEAESGENQRENFEIIYNGISDESDVLAIAMVDVLMDDAKTNVIMELAKNCFENLTNSRGNGAETNFLRLMFISRAIGFYALAGKAEDYFGVPFETAEKLHKEELFALYQKLFSKGD